MPTKKILFFCHNFYPRNTGYAIATRNLINAILDSDDTYSITVITQTPLKEEPELIHKNLLIIRLGSVFNNFKISYFINLYNYAKYVSKYFWQNHCDILFIESLDLPFFTLFLDKNIYAKCAIRIHSTSDTEHTIFFNNLIQRINRLLIRKILNKKIRWLVSTNQFHLNFAKQHFYESNPILIGNTNFFILPNPTPPIDLPEANMGSDIKAVCLGRMDKLGCNQKGFADLIYALKLLDPEVANKIHVKLIGEGDSRDELISMSLDLPNITFIEKMNHNDVLNELLSCDLVILPSRYEGLSMFALEGLATGNIALFSNTGGLADLVEGNGFLFEPQDIESLSARIFEIINMSPAQRHVMKRNSLAIISKKFLPQIVAKRFNLLHRLMNSN